MAMANAIGMAEAVGEAEVEPGSSEDGGGAEEPTEQAEAKARVGGAVAGPSETEKAIAEADRLLAQMDDAMDEDI